MFPLSNGCLNHVAKLCSNYLVAHPLCVKSMLLPGLDLFSLASVFTNSFCKVALSQSGSGRVMGGPLIMTGIVNDLR